MTTKTEGKKTKEGCEHNFVYSHQMKEAVGQDNYMTIYEFFHYVVCSKCGEVRKQKL